MTELGKILISIFLVFWSRELRGRVWDRKRARQQAEEDEEENEGPAWLGTGGDKVDSQGRKRRDSEMDDEGNVYPNGNPASPVTVFNSRTWQETETAPHHRNPSIRVNVTLAQSTPSITVPSTPEAQIHYPSVAVIPPTPGPPPSPARAPDAAALHPLRAVFERPSMSHFDSMWDMLDADAWHVLKDVVFGPGWWLLAIPSALFVFQANAQYVASGNLSVPLFQLAYQLKIPATAFWAVILLRKPVTAQQWVSLFILSAGVGIVQLHSSSPPPLVPLAPATGPPPPVAAKHLPRALAPTSLLSSSPSTSASMPAGPSQSLGLIAVVLACLSSGFASTYFERMLKSPSTPSPHIGVPTPPPSLWVRNIQLSLFGLAVGLPVALWEVRRDWTSLNFEQTRFATANWFLMALWDEFFTGFNGMTWIVIFLQVTGGLLAALVMQHADNVAKCFSTSLSILISFVCSIFLFNYQISSGVALGSTMVLFSTYSYTVPGVLSRFTGTGSSNARRRPPPSVVIHGDKG